MEYKGQLEGFPQEVVEWMQDQQEAHGNKRDASVFEKSKRAGKASGGFDWYDTKEGRYFCGIVIDGMEFSSFFELYPKKSESI